MAKGQQHRVTKALAERQGEAFDKAVAELRDELERARGRANVVAVSCGVSSRTVVAWIQAAGLAPAAAELRAAAGIRGPLRPMSPHQAEHSVRAGRSRAGSTGATH
jgi:NH3-dependent NAD+ synthetase